jgi:two-component system, chemotaxis family, chemotaxis protein CheY
MTCILYVDDSQTQLDCVRKTLTEKGHEVRSASTLDEALACMEDGKVELGLIDFHMPGTDGVQLLQEIRARAHPPSNVRFYIYTTDNKEQRDYRKHTFHGAILRKGDMPALLAQLEPVLRLMQLTKLAQR